MQHILIVEDDLDIQELLKNFLQEVGYAVTLASDGIEAISLFASTHFDLILLDIMLPKIDGFTVCELIRKQSRVPIIMLTALNGEEEQIRGLDLQVDDYITKPFYIEELILRIKRMLEKSSLIGFNKNTLETIYANGIFELDLNSFTVCKNGKKIPMRKKQFDMMLYFIRNSNKILSFEAIYQNVWNEPIPDEKTLESNIYVNIRTLRNLIEDDKKNPRHIVSVSKCGYIFVPE